MPPPFKTCPAKINLCLHVRGRRDDGYHDLCSLTAFARFGDALALEITPAQTWSADLQIMASDDSQADPQDWTALPIDDRNLALKAARLFGETFALSGRVRITLHKQIPLGAGLGGGSADAAGVLRALSAAFTGRRLPTGAIAGIGADVPVCMTPATQWLTGKGEHSRPGPVLRGTPLVLAYPRISLATGKVFAALDKKQPASPQARQVGPLVDRCGCDDLPDHPAPEHLAKALGRCGNDLQTSASALCPDIERLREDVRRQAGCLLARMTGSGSACFGIFTDQAQADRAMNVLRKDGWWAISTALL
ncbi:MAG: 4-(cytidine 5'-diphospho)-2-C-methyl-D-erythritol kinase [Pseudomonadota bacterium]